MKKKGFTLIELLVVIAIIAMLLAILMPALSKVKRIAERVVCGTNLKGLGTAQVVYAHDYDDRYAVQGRGLNHTWDDVTVGWQNVTTNVTNTVGGITVGASLYLLVREADVSPKSFVCPSSNEKEFTGKNANNLDIVQLFDFGHNLYADSPEGPGRTVSYAYQMPYVGGTGAGSGARGSYAASGSSAASFAMMADKNPFFDSRLTYNASPTQDNYVSQVSLLNLGADAGTNWSGIDRWRAQVANAQPHDREGQNVLFADGSTRYENRSDVAVQNDNIYTRWSVNPPTLELHRRAGQAIPVASRRTVVAPLGGQDTVLVNDLPLN